MKNTGRRDLIDVSITVKLSFGIDYTFLAIGNNNNTLPVISGKIGVKKGKI